MYQKWSSSTCLSLFEYLKVHLLTTPSPKLIPWFVSDVTPPDFAATIPSLLSDNFFPPPTGSETPATDSELAAQPPSRPEEHGYLRTMVTRWQSYLDSGVFQSSVPLDTPLGASNSKVIRRSHFAQLPIG